MAELDETISASSVTMGWRELRLASAVKTVEGPPVEGETEPGALGGQLDAENENPPQQQDHGRGHADNGDKHDLADEVRQCRRRGST